MSSATCEKCKDESTNYTTNLVNVCAVLPANLCNKCRRELEYYILKNKDWEKYQILDRMVVIAIREKAWDEVYKVFEEQQKLRPAVVKMAAAWLGEVSEKESGEREKRKITIGK